MTAAGFLRVQDRDRRMFICEYCTAWVPAAGLIAHLDQHAALASGQRMIEEAQR